MGKSAKANVCVYFLRDPRDMSARYVGITHQPKRRFYYHWHHRFEKCFDDSHPGTKMRQDWYRDLDNLGLMPVMDVVLTGLSRDQASRVESYISKQSESMFPGKLYQIPVGLYDPVRVIKEAFGRCNSKQREIVKAIIAST